MLYVLLFVAVMVTLPEDSAQWWIRRKAWSRATRWAMYKWKGFGDKTKERITGKIKDILSIGREIQPDEEITDEKMMEVLATRDVHDLFKEGKLNNEFVDINQPIQ